MKDGTIAVEVAVARALLQWPFLSDLSLVDALMSVFVPDTAVLEEMNGSPVLTQPASLQPWLYFNLYLTDSEFFLPILDMVRAPGRLGLGVHHPMGM